MVGLAPLPVDGYGADLERLRAEAGTAAWLVLVGRLRAELLAVALACPGPVLLVVPDGAAAAAFRDGWPEPWPGRVELVEALVAAEAEAVSWYRYNDGRRNGVEPIEALRPTYPNLKLLAVELRQPIGLAALLAGWEPAAAGAGMVLLGDGEALAEVAAAGEILRRLGCLACWPEGAGAAADSEDLEALLAAEWLAAAGAEGAGARIWRHDAALAFRSTVLAERDGLRAERDQLLARVGELEALQALVVGERDALTAQRDQSAVERDQLVARIGELEGQQAGLLGEREQLVAERDGLALRLGELEGQQAVLVGERDALTAQRDQSAVERDQLVARIGELEGQQAGLMGEREQLVAERDGLLTRANSQQERLEQINSELDEILALIDQSQPPEGALTEAGGKGTPQP